MNQEKLLLLSSFRGRLQELMARDDLTQQQLATATGISQSAISHYLRGTRTAPGVEEAIALAHHFQVTLDWLLGVDPSSPVHPADPNSESRAKRDAELAQVAKTLEEQAVKLRKLLADGRKIRPARESRTTDS